MLTNDKNSEMTPSNIRLFNKQREDEGKGGMSNLINIQEAPKALSQTRSQLDYQMKFRNQQRLKAADPDDGSIENPEFAGRSYQKK